MPTEAPAAEVPVEVEAPRKSKKRLLLIAVVAVVVLLGAGGFLVMRHHGGSAKSAVDKGPAVYYTLDPSIVVNYTDARAIHFLQVGISLMSHDQKAIDAAKAAEPAIRNALLLLFSSQDYATLSTPKGKLELQKEALQKVQAVVKQSSGESGIEAVYFTSFVMQ